MSTTEKDIDTKLNRQDFLLKLTTQCKTISEQSLEMSKRNTSGKIAEVYVACMFRWQMLYSELIITQYLL